MARRWWGVGAAVALAALLAPARPAAADAARPGNVESTITSVPAGAPFHAAVRGGDSFLELKVDRGHEVIVADYEGFPYVRYAADGVVSENQQSKATYQNRTRAASSEGPPTLNPSGPPEWKQVATSGVYVWHDHRVHWMSPTRAPEQAWQVDLTVDGQSTKIAGRYGPVDAPSALPWWLVALAVAAVVGWFARRRHVVGAVAVLVGALVAVPVVVSLVRLPQSSGLLGALIAAAAVAAVAAVAVRGPTGAALAAGGGVALGLWGIRRTDVFGHAILVTSVPTWLDRLSVALAVGTALGVMGATVWAFTRPPTTAPVPAA